MKKLLFSLTIVASLLASSCSSSGDGDGGTPGAPAITLNETQQNAFIANFTATWCGPCGSWGKPEIKRMEDISKERVHVVDFHPSAQGDNLYLVSAGVVANAVAIQGYPTMLEGITTQVGPNRGAQIVNTRLGQAPRAAVGLSYTKSSAMDYKINVKSKFLSAVQGKHAIAIYLIEDNIIDRQVIGSTVNPAYNHTNVYRGFVGAAGEELGRVLNTDGSEIAAGKEYSYSLDYKVPSSVIKQKDLSFVAVIYQLDINGTRPIRVLNSFEIKAKE